MICLYTFQTFSGKKLLIFELIQFWAGSPKVKNSLYYNTFPNKVNSVLANSILNFLSRPIIGSTTGHAGRSPVKCYLPTSNFRPLSRFCHILSIRSPAHSLTQTVYLHTKRVSRSINSLSLLEVNNGIRRC